MNAKIIIKLGNAEATQELEVNIPEQEASPRAHEAIRAAAASLGVHIPKQ